MSYETRTGRGAKSDRRGCAASDVGERHKSTADVPGGRRMGRVVEDGWKEERASTRGKGKDLTTARADNRRHTSVTGEQYKVQREQYLLP